jgi:hypothetical protein
MRGAVEMFYAARRIGRDRRYICEDIMKCLMFHLLDCVLFRLRIFVDSNVQDYQTLLTLYFSFRWQPEVSRIAETASVVSWSY